MQAFSKVLVEGLVACVRVTHLRLIKECPIQVASRTQIKRKKMVKECLKMLDSGLARMQICC
jgi:hypothetical protein